MNKLTSILFALPLYLAIACVAEGAELTAREILRESDEARGNLSGVTWTVDIVAREGGQTNTRSLEVKARGFDVFARTVSPPRRAGDTLVMVDGNMWFYQPDLSKPVPISRRQKLIGKAANGDIAATNYAEDYRVVSLSDGEHNGEACYLFDLEAKSSRSTYSKIRYWVSKKRLVGTKADYYTATGDKLIKTAEMTFSNRVTTDRGSRPFISRMVISDKLTSKDTTTMSFSRPTFTSVPSDTFNLNLLRR
jgi:outer membrane lipoprotein-sorting protein